MWGNVADMLSEMILWHISHAEFNMPMRGKIWTSPERSKKFGSQMLTIRCHIVLRLHVYQHSSLIHYLYSKSFYTTLILPYLALVWEHWSPFPQFAYASNYHVHIWNDGKCQCAGIYASFWAPWLSLYNTADFLPPSSSTTKFECW